MKKYENAYILKGSLTEEQTKMKIEEITKYFDKVKIFENKETFNGYQGLKKLAYTIRKETTGYYYITSFEGTDKQVTDIENNLRLNDNVLKFITIRI